MLSNVAVSLPAVHQALHMFNAVSYYKVNDSKSYILYILNLGVSVDMELNLKQRIPYTWKTDGINYLGIILTPKTGNLFRSNFLPFLDTQNCHGWADWRHSRCRFFPKCCTCLGRSLLHCQIPISNICSHLLTIINDEVGKQGVLLGNVLNIGRREG